jgi:hypothetical protein
MPQRGLSLNESMRIAELQAARLLKASAVTGPVVPESVIAELPRVQIERLSPIPVSGSTHWVRGCWHIIVNGAEPLVRQRYSLGHEAKHVLDAPFSHLLYPALYGMTSGQRSEQVADFFAACLLMPRPWVKRLWGRGEHDLRRLAGLFGVSQTAMRIRLLQIGLIETQARCGAAA